MMGVLFAQSYFDGADPEETEIRTLAENLYEAIDWAWASPRAPGISMGWRPEQGFLDSDWEGYNEAMFLYVLALGSESQAVDAGAWSFWTSTYGRTWGTLEGQEHLTFGPLFGHQYTAVWIDLRGLRDAYMRGRNLDYFENSRRAVYSQRAYATRHPLGWKGYGSDVWGLTACDGPTDANLPYNGQTRSFHTYAARGVNLDPSVNFDDGTLAPTAVIGSLPFAPEIVIPAIRALRDRYGTEIYGEYRFFCDLPSRLRVHEPLRMVRRAGCLRAIQTHQLRLGAAALRS